MLSRVADNLFWMSRYLERAEHTARLIDVNLDLMLDRSTESVEESWRQLFASLHLSAPSDLPIKARNVTQYLTFESENAGSVVSCIAAARENARQVRQQISSEMWEELNRLYLEVKNTHLNRIWLGQPHEFFQSVKEGSQLFQGIADSTMNHGEGWHFIRAGQSIERASNSATLLSVYLNKSTQNSIDILSSSNHYLNWMTLLRSCTAFEAYCKVYTADLRYDKIIEFLLLNGEFPHSVHFSVKMLRSALNVIAEATDIRKNTQVYRLTGRLQAMLDYDQIDEITAQDLQVYLDNIQKQCDAIHLAIYETYITYAIEEKLTV